MSIVSRPEGKGLRDDDVGFRPEMEVFQDVSGTWLVRANMVRLFPSSYDEDSKEIEVSFPSASETDYDFTRRLVETPDVVPPDVALQVLSPCKLLCSCRKQRINILNLNRDKAGKIS